MKTTKKAALVAASSALLLGLTVAQTVNADTYTVQNGDSFFGIASQYGVDPYQLAAENGMTIWSTIVPGGSLEVSGATTAVEETTEASSSEVAATDSDATWNRYPVGQCTWGVKEVAPWVSNWWGNGGDWAGSAASQGYAVGSTPVTGSIVCWTDGGYGHVGYVTQVDQDGQIQILESNYQGQQQINNYRGWFDPQNSLTPGSVSYIYPGA